MRLVKEFKDFAMRGNIVQLAIGVIMGNAFGSIVTSLVSDVIMPPIGYLVGGIKFTELKIKLPALTVKVPKPRHPGEFVEETLEASSINYGNFLQASFNFLIVALCIFAMVKLLNRLKKKVDEEPTVPAPPTPEVTLLTEIRDLLKANQPRNPNP